MGLILLDDTCQFSFVGVQRFTAQRDLRLGFPLKTGSRVDVQSRVLWTWIRTDFAHVQDNITRCVIHVKFLMGMWKLAGRKNEAGMGGKPCFKGG